MAIDKTEKIKLKAEFKDSSGNLIDPVTPVSLAIKDGASTTTVASVTNVSLGVYEYEYEVKESGIHYYTFTSADGGAEQGSFSAKPLKTAN